jgi:hypothetical protein
MKTIDAGVIKKNAPLELEFTFTNTGDKPVVIKGVRTSCGCTAAKHTEAPILPGKSSSIKVKYDTRRVGHFNKSITVQTSAEQTPTLLRIQGTVK